MRSRSRWCTIAFVLLATVLVPAAAQAQLFRAYLASNGSDANPCTVQQPCRLLPAALAAVRDGGEIWMLDSANFNTGPVVITKSVSILAIPGALGSIVGNGGDALAIDAPGVRVALRNLKILNLSAGQNGVHVKKGASLKVEGCEIAGFTSTPGGYWSGIKVATPATVTIVDTLVRDNLNGIWFEFGTGDIARTTVVGNSGVGVWANPTNASTVTVTVTDSVSSSNAYGFASNGSQSSTSRMTVVRSTAAHNSASGFQADGSPSGVMVVSQSTATHNGIGFKSFFGGTFLSLGDNTVVDNGTDTNGIIVITAPK